MELVAFVAGTDLDASERFYGGALGLRLVESTAFARVFAAGGTLLRVTQVERAARAAYTVLGWSVPDLAAAIEALEARGVTFKRYDGLAQSEAGIWTAPSGARVAWFDDPDGNVLSLSQIA